MKFRAIQQGSLYCQPKQCINYYMGKFLKITIDVYCFIPPIWMGNLKTQNPTPTLFFFQHQSRRGAAFTRSGIGIVVAEVHGLRQTHKDIVVCGANTMGFSDSPWPSTSHWLESKYAIWIRTAVKTVIAMIAVVIIPIILTSTQTPVVCIISSSWPHSECQPHHVHLPMSQRIGYLKMFSFLPYPPWN